MIAGKIFRVTAILKQKNMDLEIEKYYLVDIRGMLKNQGMLKGYLFKEFKEESGLCQR